MGVKVESLKKITAASAQEICALATAGGFKLGARESASPVDYLNELLAAGSLNEAVQFLAFALPPREAVWWACQCARDEWHEPAPPVLQAAVDAAERWVRQPTEEHRRAAMSCAQATDLKSPAAWAAVAAFWSGGSLAPENQPEVPPAPHLLGSAVAGAVMLAAVQSKPQLADPRRERYLASAIDIANGGTGRINPG
ncbi:MAG TPA: hypothetical protein VK437_06690 [Steroidobacteraceae bacterium]|nr:hypothetical protein [Steroidobacteraceae bacterium]